MTEDAGSQMFERYVDRCLLEKAEARAEAAETERDNLQRRLEEARKMATQHREKSCIGCRLIAAVLQEER